MKITYLKKACDDVISFCNCGDSRITYPPQMDCPWCGCGWLFTCITCRKAFTFAEGVELSETWEEVAEEDLNNMWKKKATQDDIDSWVEAMKELLADVQVGERYVILDGTIFPEGKTELNFDGWHSHHEFKVMPQVIAIEDRTILGEKLINRDYWTENALPEEKKWRERGSAGLSKK